MSIKELFISPLQFSKENFGWLSDAPCACVTVCAGRNLEGGSFSFFCMKLTYDDATKTHISNLKKIQHGRRYDDNYR